MHVVFPVGDCRLTFIHESVSLLFFLQALGRLFLFTHHPSKRRDEWERKTKERRKEDLWFLDYIVSLRGYQTQRSCANRTTTLSIRPVSKYTLRYDMPPNVLQYWDSNASRRRFHDVSILIDDSNDDGNHQTPELNPELFFDPKNSLKQTTQGDGNGRTLWRKILHNDVNTTRIDENDASAIESSDLLASLSSIIILNDKTEQRDWLNQVGGRLSNVSSELLEMLR